MVACWAVALLACPGLAAEALEPQGVLVAGQIFAKATVLLVQLALLIPQLCEIPFALTRVEERCLKRSLQLAET